MIHFKKIDSGLTVWPVLVQLDLYPEFWDAHPERTYEGSPHHGVSDIWVRFRPQADLKTGQDFRTPHIPAFYPAWGYLTTLHPIVYRLMAQVQATMLGGILITKISPGGSVKPHNDKGSWHAEYFNTKVYVGLQSNEKCVNRCENEEIVIRPGEVWTFDNLKTHSVVNAGHEDRITAIVCMRTE